ncbi:Nucleoside diphosphate kinase [Wolbachia endosymbiont of Drosophila simulans wNo]|uniref:nucleoside-diphosphate kinase n=1 Tax=unclassified Wolbachia TaxID=2640676 RepID=UPI0002D24E0D|nr:MULTISPECIES: nucleoside-diphosphate kinase [unclassified Wolbachia]AGJ98836.1 Nucleoside diphosphate kinase [Wolbachia endosymbiont of Drosophila simulans wNo]AZU37379.1 nucleoside-diphosphate kinase [Wolbachia endosymbiont of Bemisia tabaci]OAB82132.1 nucleoside-diphosphate kinase [Wolbachia endosymbiont of Laodelphax striatellus]QCB63024.1 nucleoside-diphosphate kinase [Wolbachia endosymbiont of Drosophila mauritiana]QCB64070.1 nucleoside-diphosphate kinase [Wolbachia endosymbiont of Dro
MAIERTLSILKPDAVKNNITGSINSYIEKSGLKIIAQRKMLLTKKQAELFYEIHKDRPFFEELVEFMTSGSVIVQVLIGENAVSKYRQIMGATDPKQADKGTIRGDFANDISENRVHGSDSLENAHREIAFFFAECELV